MKKLSEKDANDPLKQLKRMEGQTETEPSLGIKQARILMNEDQSMTVNELITEARENHWMEEVASKQREQIRHMIRADSAEHPTSALDDLYMEKAFKVFEKEGLPSEILKKKGR